MLRIRYGKIIASCAAVAVLSIFFTLVLTHSGGAKPHPAPLPHPQGTPTFPSEDGREAIKPGNYATAINIHNPSLATTVTLHKRAVLAPYEDFNGEKAAFPPSQLQPYTLPAGYAVEVDCADIRLLLDTPGISSSFIKGFVSIFVPASQTLDVVGVYTAEPPSVSITDSNGSPVTEIPGIALEMLQITPQVVFTFGPPNPTAALPGRAFNEYSAKFLCSPPPKA